MGGGGFSMEPENPLLDDYVLGLTGKERPRICFLPTASGDDQGYIDRFLGAFPPERAEATALTLFRRGDAPEPRERLLSQDVIYVGGGSTANMLAVWRVHGLDTVLVEAWECGVVLAGLSAGMICWFQEGVTDSFGRENKPLAGCLELLEGSACPHYDGEEERRPAYLRLVGDGSLRPGFAADDGVALLFEGRELAEVVSSRPKGRAFRVSADGGKAREEPLAVRYLGKAGA